MQYIAYAGVKLKNDVTNQEKNKWYPIKKIGDIEYQWCLRKNLNYEVIAGVFDGAKTALTCAKQMYVNLIYALLEGGFQLENSGCESYESRFYTEDEGDKKSWFQEEKYFFLDKTFAGVHYGPAVYEVENGFEEFFEKKAYEVHISIGYDSDLTFDSVDDKKFTYNKKAQELLHSVFLAENSSDYGMRMSIYCGILEHLAEDGKKSQDVQTEIDELIKHVKSSSLQKDEQEQLMNFLGRGKEKSASQKCQELIAKYAKSTYAKHTAKKIFMDAYSIRSAFSHGERNYDKKKDISRYIKFVVLDVIRQYMIETEGEL